MPRPVLATLGYVMSADRAEVLMIHRNKRPNDVHFGKYNGLGGRLEPGEDIVSGMRREIAEEAGIVADVLSLRGTIAWPGFGGTAEGWFGFIFRIDGWSGEPHGGNHEGTLEWVRVDELADRPMWPSDHEFLPLVFDDDPRTFHGCMPFVDNAMAGWSYQRV